MIPLTRLDGTTFWLNPDLIQWVDAAGDTRIVLTTGTRLLVTEDPETVVERVAHYRWTLLQERRSPAAAFALVQRAKDE